MVTTPWTFRLQLHPHCPPGTRIIIHEKPSIRCSWAPHGIDGWYLGPALNSYHCYTVWATDTQAQRIADTIVWLPSTIPMPTASSTDYILARINDIVHALQFPSPNLPLAPLCDSQVQALKQLMAVLHGSISPIQPHATPAATLIVVPPITSVPINALPASPQPASSLRVDPLALASNPALSTSPQPAESLRVHLPDAHADNVMVPTNNCTAPPPPLPATITTGPRTRSQCQPCHSPHLQALHATTPTANTPPPPHIAYHGNAFNPDTSKIAKC